MEEKKKKELMNALENAFPKTNDKERKIKAWAIMQKNYQKYWLSYFPFTGAFAIFESKKKAMLAREYNASLMKEEKRPKEVYRIVPIAITYTPPQIKH